MGTDAVCDAVVVAVEGFEVTLPVTKDLGERAPASSLVTAPYYLPEILAQRLSEARQGRLPAKRHLASALIHQEPSRPLAPPPSSPRQPAPLRRAAAGPARNPEQQAAIRQVLGLETAFVWPAGTRKTSPLARLVAELVAGGERALNRV